MSCNRPGGVVTPALTVGLIALVSVLAAPPFGSPETAASDLVRATMSEHGIPGMQAAVWSDGRIIWREAAGLADVEQKVSVTHRTVFRLGSVSKIITASLAARLVQIGVVDLDREIREYLPSFPDKGAVITLRNLLGHLGGIRHYSNRDYDPLAPGGIIDLRAYPDSSAALALFEDDPLVAKPGTVYRYSTFGYTLAGAVLEAAAGKPFADLLQDHVLSPLEFEQTTVDDLRRVVPHRTAFYDTEDGELVKAYPLNAAYKWAGGGLLSTSAELVRFGAAHFEGTFLTEETRQVLFAEQQTSDGRRTGVALGWRVGEDSAGRRIAHHAGSMPGCRAVLVIYPEQRLAVAVLSNLTATPRAVERVAQSIAALFLEVQRPVPE